MIVSNALFAAEGDFDIPMEAERAQHPAFRVVPGAASVEQAAQLLRPKDLRSSWWRSDTVPGRSGPARTGRVDGVPVATTHVAHGTFQRTSLEPWRWGTRWQGVEGGSPTRSSGRPMWCS